MTCPPCNHNCNQGECLGSINASRAALGLPPLHRDQPKDDKTGWPTPELMQDDHRGLFGWFASKLDSRRLVRESAERIAAEEQDEPPYSYESVTTSLPWCIWIGTILCAVLCIVILSGGADVLYAYMLKR